MTIHDLCVEASAAADFLTDQMPDCPARMMLECVASLMAGAALACVDVDDVEVAAGLLDDCAVVADLCHTAMMLGPVGSEVQTISRAIGALSADAAVALGT